MASGLVALLDDIAAIARLAAASADDVASMTAKTSVKAAGVVIDDTAVTPRYVTGLSPDRELPIIAKIARGSLRNKLVFLLPAALLMSAFAEWLITPLLMIGGAYLCFEGTEKVVHAIFPSEDHDKHVEEITDPKELEDRQVSGAIRTDFILSAEIMAISLNSLDGRSIWMQGIVLAVVAIVITAAVYGVVGLIVKMDDVGLHMARGEGGSEKIGRALVSGMPKVLTVLTIVGTAAMIWVGGGILSHGLHEYHLTPIPDWIHHLEHWGDGLLGGFTKWLFGAFGNAILGLLAGGVIVAVLHVVRAARGGAGTSAH